MGDEFEVLGLKKRKIEDNVKQDPTDETTRDGEEVDFPTVKFVQFL